jgi:hypothetical protein
MQQDLFKNLEKLFFHGTPIRCPFNLPIYEDGDNNPTVRCKHRKRFQTWHALKMHAGLLARHHDEDVRAQHRHLSNEIIELENQHPATAARHRRLHEDNNLVR